jgi:hypothetical protein
VTGRSANPAPVDWPESSELASYSLAGAARYVHWDYKVPESTSLSRNIYVFWRAHPIAGAAIYVSPIIIFIGFIMDAIHMAELFPPPIIEGIGAVIFCLGMIGILHKWYYTAIVDKRAAIPPARRRARSAPAQAGESASLFSTIILSLVFFGVFVGMVATYAINRYGAYRDGIENTRLEVSNIALVPPGAYRAGHTTTNLSANIFTYSRGFYTVSGMTRNYAYKLSDHRLSVEEESREIKVVDAGIDAPVQQGSEIYPNHLGEWFSIAANVTDDEWRDITSGNKFLYLFVELQYYVEGNVRVTEYCVYIDREFPSVHTCIDHNRVFTKG